MKGPRTKLTTNGAADLATRLTSWRKSHRWTRAMASEFLDVRPRTYEQWEQGTRSPRGIGLKALEKAIRV